MLLGGTSLIALLLAALLSVPARLGPPAPSRGAEDLDLAKAPLWRDRECWVGKSVHDVLPASAVSKVVLLRANTSAPADIDIANIRALLSDASHFERSPTAPDLSSTIWEALLVTTDHRLLLLRVDREWALLVAPEGHGYFRSR